MFTFFERMNLKLILNVWDEYLVVQMHQGHNRVFVLNSKNVERKEQYKKAGNSALKTFSRNDVSELLTAHYICSALKLKYKMLGWESCFIPEDRAAP